MSRYILTKYMKEMSIIIIYIAGDSTAAPKQEKKRPETGWGEKLHLFFDSRIRFENCAVNGRSTKSFIEEKRLEKIDEKIERGDFLFIQFGHNDQKLEDPTRGTEPFGEYLDNLRTFTKVAKKNGATPVLLTPISRRDYLTNGLLNPDSLGLYPEAVRKFCEENSFVLLDTFLDTQKWLEGHTQVETKQFFLKGKSGELLNYPDGVDDDTHLNEEGAIKVAEIVANEIAKSSLYLKKYLVKN